MAKTRQGKTRESPAQRGIDEESLRDELRPKDIPAGGGGSRSKGRDEEGDMPTGLGRKTGFEDYNPAARRNIKKQDLDTDDLDEDARQE